MNFMSKTKCTYYDSCFQKGVHLGDIHISTEAPNLNKKELTQAQVSAKTMIDLLSSDELIYKHSIFIGNSQNKNKQFLRNKLHQYIVSTKDTYDLVEFIGELIQTLGKEEYFHKCDQCGDYNSSYKIELN